MTLLKDLVWRSALRRGAGEVEVGGSGGSSFAHLVEDMGDESITADWGLYATSDLEAPFDGTYSGLGPDGKIESWVVGAAHWSFIANLVGDADIRFGIKDASLHWGDGTAAPDVSLARGGATALSIESEAWTGFSLVGSDGATLGFAAGATAADKFDLYCEPGQAKLAVYGYGLETDLVRFKDDGNIQFAIPGKGITLKNPAGTVSKTVTLAADGNSLVLV